MSAQPKAARIRRPWVRTTPFEVGDVLQVGLSTNDRVLLLTAGHIVASAERTPLFVTLNWIGTGEQEHRPNLHHWNTRHRWPGLGQPSGRCPFSGRVASTSRSGSPRSEMSRTRTVRTVGSIAIEPLQSRRWEMTWWKDLDLYLRARLGLNIDDAAISTE